MTAPTEVFTELLAPPLAEVHAESSGAAVKVYFDVRTNEKRAVVEALALSSLTVIPDSWLLKLDLQELARRAGVRINSCVGDAEIMVAK